VPGRNRGSGAPRRRSGGVMRTRGGGAADGSGRTAGFGAGARPSPGRPPPGRPGPPTAPVQPTALVHNSAWTGRRRAGARTKPRFGRAAAGPRRSYAHPEARAAVQRTGQVATVVCRPGQGRPPPVRPGPPTALVHNSAWTGRRRACARAKPRCGRAAASAWRSYAHRGRRCSGRSSRTAGFGAGAGRRRRAARRR
jgi:hypothetical protein